MRDFVTSESRVNDMYFERNSTIFPDNTAICSFPRPVSKLPAKLFIKQLS